MLGITNDVATLLTAVAAAGGAVLAGLIAYLATHRQVVAMRREGEAQRQSEHRRWQRDARLRAYTDLLASAQGMERRLAELATMNAQGSEAQLAVNEEVNNVRRAASEVQIVGPSEIGQQGRLVAGAAQEFITLVSRNPVEWDGGTSRGSLDLLESMVRQFRDLASGQFETSPTG